MAAQPERTPGRSWVNSWEQSLRAWAYSVGLDPDEAVRVERMLNPIGAEWKDFANMRRRVFEFITQTKL